MILRLWLFVILTLAGAFAPSRASARIVETRAQNFFPTGTETRPETAPQVAGTHLGFAAHGYELASGYAQAAETAAGSGGRRIALGLDAHLDEFARAQGATTWKTFPDKLNWKPTMLDHLADPNTKVLFNLESVEVGPGLTRALRGAGGATDWELLQIRQNPQWWDTIEWFQGGKTAPNPFK